MSGAIVNQENRGSRLDRSDKLNVVFIAGSGRSGSTLLDRLLGRSKETFSAGEIRSIWRRSVKENFPCGCGEYFHGCEFWNAVMDKAFGGMDQVQIDRILYLQSRVDRFRFVPFLTQTRRPSAFASELAEYDDVMKELYKAIGAVSGAQSIVDSSKVSTHGLVLANSGEFDLKVLHLIRDSRAVAHSWTRAKKQRTARSDEDLMNQKAVSKSAYHWNMENMCAALLQGKADASRRIRYEDFATRPAATFDSIVKTADLDCPGLDEGDVSLSVNHTVLGNPIRFDTGKIEIRLDDEWRSKMASADKRTVTMITWPLLLKYGYDLKAQS